MKFINLFFVLLFSITLITSCSSGSGDNKGTVGTVSPLSEDLVELPISFDSKGISFLSTGMVLYFEADAQLIGQISKVNDQNGQKYDRLYIDLFKNQLTKSHSRFCWLGVDIPTPNSSPVINFKAGQRLEISGTRTLGDLKNGNGYYSYIEFGPAMTIACDDYFDHQPNAPDQLAEVTIGELKQNFPGKILFAAKK